MPGIGRSNGASYVIWKNTPSFEPPLCSWPVECRKRGPKPTVVATCSASRTVVRMRCSAASSSSSIGTYALNAT